MNIPKLYSFSELCEIASGRDARVLDGPVWIVMSKDEQKRVFSTAKTLKKPATFKKGSIILHLTHIQNFALVTASVFGSTSAVNIKFSADGDFIFVNSDGGGDDPCIQGVSGGHMTCTANASEHCPKGETCQFVKICLTDDESEEAVECDYVCECG